MTAGAKVAQAALNATGGLGGSKIALDFCNGQLSPAVDVACAHSTLAKHPQAMIGCESTWTSSGLPIYSAAKVPSVQCPETDFNNPWNFGFTLGASGAYVAGARFVCTLKNVHSVTGLLPDLAQTANSLDAAFQVLKNCGKTVIPAVLYPLTGVDVTPYVQKVASSKADFLLFEGIPGPFIVQFYKAFQQNGIPGSHVITVGSNLVWKTILQPAGSTMNGTYTINQFDMWGEKGNPDVNTFIKNVKKYNRALDYRDPNIEWGYALVMWVATAAKQIGYKRFNAQTFAKFMQTATKVPMPLMREWINPGPAAAPAIKAPYDKITQWINGKIVAQKTGRNKDGWMYGY
jgi:branched-chain amino acid transport system substrate-binding protein